MANPLTKDMLSDMANMLDHLQKSLNDTCQFGFNTEEASGVELVSETGQDLETWQFYWQTHISKLQTVHKWWSTTTYSEDKAPDVEVFHGMCARAAHF